MPFCRTRLSAKRFIAGVGANVTLRGRCRPQRRARNPSQNPGGGFALGINVAPTIDPAEVSPAVHGPSSASEVILAAPTQGFHKETSRPSRRHGGFTSVSGPRKVVARLECSLQPDAGETTSTGMRQEVDIRYVVTSLKGAAQHLYEDVYCQRGQMENLIKLHKAQLASDRMSCHSATANQVRLALHTAAFWLMHGVRAAIPQTSPLATAEFATIRERLIKIGARVIEHIARIRIQLPTSCPEAVLFRAVALGLMLSGP